jgi:hypothetical protein
VELLYPVNSRDGKPPPRRNGLREGTAFKEDRNAMDAIPPMRLTIVERTDPACTVQQTLEREWFAVPPLHYQLDALNADARS